MSNDFASNLTPKEIVEQLDKHIVGQTQAKRAVAIALRNRLRRMQTPSTIQKEINPKNILMIGPTGVGKTEIARRLAHLSNAPFLKVEATKFTEIGYVGREVESIIKDIMSVAYKQVQNIALSHSKKAAHKQAIEKILDILLPQASDLSEEEKKKQEKTRKKFKEKLIRGELDDKEIEISLNQSKTQIEILGAPGLDEISDNIQEMFSQMQRGKKTLRKTSIKEAFKHLQEEIAHQLIDQEAIKEEAIKEVSNNGIVFIDEIDKITSGNNRDGNVSREGVQRDLLPLIEGCSVNTKYGVVDTSHILFIASGAFHLSKPSDLIPELQGRLPIRVELEALNIEDFYAILTEPDFSLIKQYQALLKTESISLSFKKEALTAIAKLAFDVNKNTENIGARRLHTLLEKLLEDILFNAPNHQKKIIITQKYVNDHLESLAQNYDLSRYIL